MKECRYISLESSVTIAYQNRHSWESAAVELCCLDELLVGVLHVLLSLLRIDIGANATKDWKEWLLYSG